MIALLAEHFAAHDVKVGDPIRIERVEKTATMVAANAAHLARPL